MCTKFIVFVLYICKLNIRYYELSEVFLTTKECVLREIVRGPEYPHITLSFSAAIFINLGFDLLSQKNGHLSPGSRTSDYCEEI